MSNLRNVAIAYQDSWNIDAFGRARVSNTGQRFDAEFIYDKQPLLFDEVTVSGGTVVYNADSRDVTLNANNTTTGTLSGLIQKWNNPYTPGNSQLVEITGTLNEANLEGEVSFFLRDGITGLENETTQENWLNPTLDLDWTKSQILMMDFQSLKVGRIRFFLVRDGVPTKLHEITNDNRYVAGYWQYPALPVCWKIYNTETHTVSEMVYGNQTNGIGIRFKTLKNAGAKMRAICCTVKSEGGAELFDMKGFVFSADSGLTAKTVSTTMIPIISIRVKQFFKTVPNGSLTIPLSYSVQSDNPLLYKIILNPATLTGANFQDVDADSAVQVDISATAYTGGSVVYSDYLATGGRNTVQQVQGLLGRILLSVTPNNTLSTITIVAVRTTSSNASTFGQIGWKEIR